MDLTAEEAAAIRFRGTRYAYDRLEVDRFRTRVIATLEAYEQALADSARRIERLEKQQPRGAARWLPQEPAPGSTPAPEAAAPVSAHAVDDGLSRVLSWVSQRQAESEIEGLIAGAHEEARMIRALAGEQAAVDIAVLTEQARQGALDVTTRAARLASDTEDAAHRRADEIVEAAAQRSERDSADMDELSRRIVSLRSSIAAVQDRLDALADEGDATSQSAVIDLDLIDPQEPRTTKRRRNRAAVTAGADAAGADELEARVAKLRDRLENQ